MFKWVINQDRDVIVKIENFLEIRIVLVYYNDNFIGVNLRYEDILLGTFDSLEESFIELKNLINNTECVYKITD